jgi:hypothetical protein
LIAAGRSQHVIANAAAEELDRETGLGQTLRQRLGKWAI